MPKYFTEVECNGALHCQFYLPLVYPNPESKSFVFDAVNQPLMLCQFKPGVHIASASHICVDYLQLLNPGYRSAEATCLVHV